ncbi:helix-turn-helix domain-containing protein [Variovorax sp. RT4R15]|uniref:helix-turn-helix domain-containing protein n=1 Tax=Variovorax sp. RT4R15 TaxID=3443737 RepID=UPI003F468AD6
MSKYSPSLAALPAPAQTALARTGSRLRAHRLQRGWTVADMAERLLCSPTTWRALEAGKPGTSIGLLAHALWLFGEIDSLDTVAPAPTDLAANRRVRRKAGSTAPGVIDENERDF